VSGAPEIFNMRAVRLVPLSISTVLIGRMLKERPSPEGGSRRHPEGISMAPHPP
jgi:hypothetical protein